MPQLISVIIPVYNKEEHLAQSIESVLSQTYPHFELLLINDGSTDTSAEICKEYQAKDDRIHCFFQENKGVSAARNLGIKQAKGEWIYFLDADDFIDPNCLEETALYFDKEVEVIDFGVRRFKPGKTVPKQTECNPFIETDHFKDYFLNYQYEHAAAWHHLIRFSLLKKNNIFFDEELTNNEDLLFMWTVLCNASGFVSTGKELINKMMIPSSLSIGPMNRNKVESKLKFLDRWIEVAERTGKIGVLKKRINSRAITYLGDLNGYRENGTIPKDLINNYYVFYKKNRAVLTSPILKIAGRNVSLALFLRNTKKFFRPIYLPFKKLLLK